MFGRIDSGLFERAVAAVENDPEVVRLWIETMKSGGDDPELGYNPVLVCACRRCNEIVQKIIPSDTTFEQTQVWLEVRRRLTVKLGPIDKRTP